MKDFLEELRKAVVASLRKVFDFSCLDPNGKEVKDTGPGISIAASDSWSCSKSLWELHRLHIQAEERLNDAKPGEDCQGGVQVQADRCSGISSDSLNSLVKDLRNFAATEAQEKAASELKDLARDDDNKIAIANAGAIPLLVQLLRDGTPLAREVAAGALHRMAGNDDNKIAIATAGAIPPLVQLLRDGTPLAREVAAGALHRMAGNDDNKIAIAKAGAIPLLVRLVSSGTPLARESAVGALQRLGVKGCCCHQCQHQHVN